MTPSLPQGIKFQKGPGRYKYVAIFPDGRKVKFGHKDYQHYKDSVPGKIWSHMDHRDPKRRERYRKRHAGIMTKDGTPAYKKRYTPSWFSYYFLW